MILRCAVVTVLITTGVAPAVADDCQNRDITVGIVKASGCFTQSGSAYETTGAFTLNGFSVTPQNNAKVTFSPDSVTTNDHFVTLSATHPTFGTMRFANVKFAFHPPTKGEAILTESAISPPYISLLGVAPISIGQPITITEDGTSKLDLTFSVGGFFASLIAKTNKQLAFGVGMEVKDQKFRIASGKFGVSEFELAELLKVNDASLEFAPPSDLSFEFDGGLKPMSGFTVIGGAGFGEGPAMKFAKLGLGDLNRPLGNSGIFLQKLAVTLNPSQPYGGAGQITMSVGPKVKFFGKEVTAVEADGKVELRAADEPRKKPAYFSTTGAFRLMTLPVANAGFTYWFGQGTAFNASVGIGLPSGTNDPNQPTYVGGGLQGWTTARSFDLEGNARLKLLGIDMLGAKTVISDYGLAGCVQIGLWIGGGVRWSDGQGEMLGGTSCDIGKYQRQRSAMQGAGDGKTRLQLDPGERIVRISGDDAPQVTLTDGDREISSPHPDDADGIQKDDDGTSFSTDSSTVFVLDEPAGDWAVRAGEDSIGTIETAKPLPAHRTKAWVTGQGRTRTLQWSARAIPNQKLHFSEILPGGGEVPILSTRKASGSVQFRPVPGSWGRERKLAVDVTQRFNTPRDSLIADTFRVRRAPAPKPVQGLRAQRITDRLRVTWQGKAKRYRVDVTPTDSGATFRKEVSKKRATFTVGTTDMLRVSVAAVNAQGRVSRARTVRVDTDRIVADLPAAAQQAVANVRVSGRKVTTIAPCPQGTECRVLVRVVRDGQLLGKAGTYIPGDMADRIVVRSSAPLRGATVRVVVRQNGERRAVSAATVQP